jgi:hypothetical protein
MKPESSPTESHPCGLTGCSARGLAEGAPQVRSNASKKGGRPRVGAIGERGVTLNLFSAGTLRRKSQTFPAKIFAKHFRMAWPIRPGIGRVAIICSFAGSGRLLDRNRRAQTSKFLQLLACGWFAAESNRNCRPDPCKDCEQAKANPGT